MLVWVASFQRSGNTLTMQTLHDVFGIDRFCSIHDPDVWLTGIDRSDSYEVPEELAGLDRDELLEAIRERPEPFFVKTHDPDDSEDSAPALYIVRDGRDVHVSRTHWVADRKVGPIYELPFEPRLRQIVSYGSWSEHVRAWRTRSGPTAILRYEDLRGDSTGVVKAACDDLGVPLPEPTGKLTPFSELQERNPVQHRRGESGSWQEEMPMEIEERFWGVHWEQMEALGYE